MILCICFPPFGINIMVSRLLKGLRIQTLSEKAIVYTVANDRVKTYLL